MSNNLLSLYTDYRPFKASVCFAREILRRRHRDDFFSIMNRWRDYLLLGSRKDLLPLHLRLSEILEESKVHWKSYDYGRGYFYQSYKALGISGLRDTETRIERMSLRERLAGKTVLDIGSNCGFLSMQVTSVTESLHGMDISGFLIEISRAAQRHVGIQNCNFYESDFESFQTDLQFDAICSFANHRTFDGNTKHSLEEWTAGGELDGICA